MATTLDELVVTIQADVEGLRKGMAEASRVMAESTAKIQKAVDSMSTEGTKSLLSFQGIAQTALGVFTGETLLKGIEHAKEAIKELFNVFVVEGVKGATAAEDAQVRLNFALAQAGHYSNTTSESILQLAESIQSTTKFENDAVTQSAVLIESLGRLNEEGLKKATRGAVDLAAGLGIDLQTASHLVGKAAAGEIGTFARYGLVLSEGATRAETFSKVITTINQRFGGAAAAQVNTYSGATAQLKNNWEDLTKELGKAFTTNQAVIETMKAATKMLEQWTTSIVANRQDIKLLIAEAVVPLINAMQMLNTTAKVTTSAVMALAAPIRLIISAADALSDISINPSLSGQISAVIPALKKFANASKEALADVVRPFTAESTFSKIGDILEHLAAPAQKGFEAVKTGAVSIVEPVNQAEDPLWNLTAAMKRMGDAGQQLGEGLVKFKPGEDFKDQMDIAKFALETHLIDVQKFNSLEIAAFEQRNKADLESLKAALTQKKLGDEDYLKAVRELHNKEALERMDLGKKQKDAEQKQNDERYSAVSKTFGNISSLMRVKNKELFEIGKAASIAQAIIDGYAAVQKTLAEGGFFAIPLAISIGVMTAANVANIQSQQLALRSGIDTVPGIGFLDQVPAVLAPGERVVPADTNRDLKNYLSGNQPQVDLLGSIDAKLSRLHAVMSASLNINIDGQAIFSVMRDQLRSGRTLA